MNATQPTVVQLTSHNAIADEMKLVQKAANIQFVKSSKNVYLKKK